MIIEAVAAIVSDLVRCSIHACIAPGWLAGWRVKSREAIEAIVAFRSASRRRRLDVVGLVDLWSCGLVDMIVVVRRREEPGEGHCWIVGSLAGWRVGGKKGRRARGSSILSSTVLEVCEDARMRGCEVCVRVRSGSVTGLYTEIIRIGSRKQRTVTVA